jgi:hypothetical protein
VFIILSIIFVNSINGRKYSDGKQTLPFVWGATPDEVRQMCLEASSLGQQVYILFVGTGNFILFYFILFYFILFYFYFYLFIFIF